MTVVMFHTNISRKLRRHKLIIILVVIGVILFILNTDFSPDLYLINFKGGENVSCHYVIDGDTLQVIDENFTPSNPIFFHETSCRGVLNSRQACSVESAARTHPYREIYVLFSAPVSKTAFQQITFELLQKFANVKFRRVHIVDYARKTPIQELVSSGALNRTRWPISHTSDVLRFLTLYKWGGLYLDLDVMVMKNLDGLPKSWAARENDAFVASSALAFGADDVGKMVAYAALSDLSTSFRGEVRGQNGPVLITRVLQKVCQTDEPVEMTADKCKGFEVYPPDLFYPISPGNPQLFFEEGDLPTLDAYTYHVWNRQTMGMNVNPNSPYAKLAKLHCPVIYETFRGAFGS